MNAFQLQLPSQLRSDASLSEANIKTNLDLAQEESLKNQDDVKFSMDDAEQSSFDKTAKLLGGQEAYQKAFDKRDTRKRTAILDYRKASIAVGFYVRCCP